MLGKFHHLEDIPTGNNEHFPLVFP